VTCFLTFKDLMGALAVVIAVVAYAIYAWQTLRGEARPHPLSWLIFGILTGTGYLVQLDQAAGPGSWVMGVTTIVCLLLCLMSFAKGERVFPWYEWAFLAAAAIVFGFYLWSRSPVLVAETLSGPARERIIANGPAISAVLASLVNVIGFGPTVTKAWSRPHSDSVTTFMLNSVKFVPSFFAMKSLSVATCVLPATLVVANAAVAAVIYARRRYRRPCFPVTAKSEADPARD
jgi:hypothetical protein